jgi:hypothetical protein
MAIVMKLRWEGVTPQQYDKACETAAWETDPPDGGVFHVAWFGDDGINVLDVWDSAEQFEAFLGTRLQAATQAAGMEGEPTVEISPAHRVFDVRQATAWS